MMYFNSNLQEAAKSSCVSSALKSNIDSFLRDAALEIEKDMREEGKERICLVKAKNFNKFVREHQEDFEAFGKFLTDYQDAYAYNWKDFYAVSQCIFMFKVKMPGKVRMMELTGYYNWVLDALEDDDICRYIIRNFALYANMHERFLDDNGDVLDILEIVYNKLLKKSYPENSVQCRLRGTLYEYFFTDFT